MKKICVITGTRAEYGLLRLLINGIDRSNKMNLQLIVTGMHLSSNHGETYSEIEKDGFRIDKKIEMLLSADSPSSISKSTGLGLIGFADAYNQLKPNIVFVLGDRFETFAATIAALYAGIPIAHIHGGETTLGSFDEAMRHSITKMAWWHFVASDVYRNRVIQLGENPNRVFNVGGMGVDSICNTKLLSKRKLINLTGINFANKNLLITFHPVTLELGSSKMQFQALLDALDDTRDVYFIFTMPNSDPDSKIIKEMIDSFVIKNKKRSISFDSLGTIKYLSVLKYVDGVLGNSSSGLTEAPTFKIGTINIGDRQQGRMKAKSVIDCNPNKSSIKKAIDKLYSKNFQKSLNFVKNPYGIGNATKKILKIINDVKIPNVIKKEFYDL